MNQNITEAAAGASIFHPTEVLRVGTIGSGSIVKSILNGIARTEGITCTAVYSRTQEKGQQLADEFGVPKVYTDLEALMNDPELDYIYVASPNSMHFEHARLALLHGKNVLCEKPFTSTVKEADELIALAKEKHLLLYETIVTMYLPNFELLRRELPKIGKMRLMICNYSQYSSRYDSLLEGRVTNVFDPVYSGGCLQDINFYNLYLAVGLFGEPEDVKYYPNKYVNGIDTSGVLILKYPDFVATLAGAKDTWGNNSAQLEGEKGYIYIRDGSNGIAEFTVSTKDSTQTVNVQPDPDRWYYEIQNLTPLLHMRCYEDCYCRLETTRLVVSLIEKARLDAGIRFAADN